MIHTGDCVEVMAAMPENSVDAIVCDPPYGLEFMGKEWDRLGAVAEHPDDGEGLWGRTSRVRYGTSATSMQEWHQGWATEALRVAKPGAYLLAFGGTRTYHRLTVAIEDAGWIIRDCLVWAYASGFPKSKALLKPAWEPIVMARKPGPLRELAIDACRIGYVSEADRTNAQTTQGVSEASATNSAIYGSGKGIRTELTEFAQHPAGRWPANVILTDAIFDGDVDGVVGGGKTSSGLRTPDHDLDSRPGFSGGWDSIPTLTYGDTGTYSRFFLIPKAARSEREPLLRSEREPLLRSERELPFDDYNRNVGNVLAQRRANHHPTVKPLDLMRHLVRLVTPSGGTVLDPFLGSGTTAIAAEMEGFDWIGIEREPEYVAIAEARLMGVQRGLGLTA